MYVYITIIVTVFDCIPRFLPVCESFFRSFFCHANGAFCVVLHRETNRGYGDATNGKLGIKIRKHEYLYFFNRCDSS